MRLGARRPSRTSAGLSLSLSLVMKVLCAMRCVCILRKWIGVVFCVAMRAIGEVWPDKYFGDQIKTPNLSIFRAAISAGINVFEGGLRATLLEGAPLLTQRPCARGTCLDITTDDNVFDIQIWLILCLPAVSKQM